MPAHVPWVGLRPQSLWTLSSLTPAFSANFLSFSSCSSLEEKLPWTCSAQDVRV